MTENTIHLSMELKTADSLLYAQLALLDAYADTAEEHTADGFLTEANWETLRQRHSFTADNEQFYRCRYQQALKIWGVVCPDEQSNHEKVLLLSSNINIRQFDEVKGRLVSLVQQGGLPLPQVPWVMHLFFQTFFTYQESAAPRPVAQIFAMGLYDCTEYTEAMQDLLNAVGIETKAVTFHLSAETGHAFLAYRLNGKWGFLSVKSFSPPVYKTRADIYRIWDGERSEGGFNAGLMQDGRLLNASVYPGFHP